jgi:hypothetical protein
VIAKHAQKMQVLPSVNTKIITTKFSFIDEVIIKVKFTHFLLSTRLISRKGVGNSFAHEKTPTEKKRIDRTFD